MSEKQIKEDREFQLEMLCTQILCNNVNSFLTMIVALVFSLGVTWLTLFFVGIKPETNINFLEYSIIWFLIGFALVIFYIIFNCFYIPTRLNNLRRFIREDTHIHEKRDSSEEEEDKKGKSKIKENLYWVLWGIYVAFLMQIIYDEVGELPNIPIKFVIGCIMEIILFFGLIRLNKER